MIDEDRFVIQLSSRLDMFRKTANGYNFRCPYCGDSSKNKFKARGYLFPGDDGGYVYNCFNCSAPNSFYSFLELLEPSLAKEYTVEKFKGSGKKIVRRTSHSANSAFSKTKDHKELLTRCDTLHELHSARKYIDSRRIDPSLVYYIKNPKEFIEHYSEVDLFDDLPKIIFPLEDEKGKCFGFVLRSIEKFAKHRYQTIIFDKSKIKVYNLSRINKDNQLYVVEGIMDCLCLKNSIAALDSSLHKTAKKLELDMGKTTLIFDNEPRNKWIVRAMQRAIKDGWSIFVWPKQIKYKDVNECNTNNLDLHSIIDRNTYRGIAAKMKLNNWKICE